MQHPSNGDLRDRRLELDGDRADAVSDGKAALDAAGREHALEPGRLGPRRGPRREHLLGRLTAEHAARERLVVRRRNAELAASADLLALIEMIHEGEAVLDDIDRSLRVASLDIGDEVVRHVHGETLWKYLGARSLKRV